MKLGKLFWIYSLDIFGRETCGHLQKHLVRLHENCVSFKVFSHWACLHEHIGQGGQGGVMDHGPFTGNVRESKSSNVARR